MRSQTSPPSSHSSPKLDLSLAQVLGSAAATLTAAVLTSFAGVKGTLIGVAGMSVIATSGTAVYSHALRRSLASARAGGPSLPPLPRLTRRGGFRLALLAAPFVVFGLAFGVITIVEAIAGAPLSHVVSGQGVSGGTTISHAATGGGGDSRPRTPSTTVTPQSTSTSATPSAGAGSASPRSSPARSPSTVQQSELPSSTATNPSLRSSAGPQPSSPPAPSAPGTLGPSR